MSKGEQLLSGSRGDRTIFGDLFEEANAEIALEAPHLRVHAGLRDGVRKFARRARVAARRRHAVEPLELIEKDHILTVIESIKIGNWWSST